MDTLTALILHLEAHCLPDVSTTTNTRKRLTRENVHLYMSNKSSLAVILRHLLSWYIVYLYVFEISVAISNLIPRDRGPKITYSEHRPIYHFRDDDH